MILHLNILEIFHAEAAPLYLYTLSITSMKTVEKECLSLSQNCISAIYVSLPPFCNGIVVWLFA